MMNRMAPLALYLFVSVSFVWSAPAQKPASPMTVTFTKDVAPIIQKHCQVCHRPGEAAPFSMLTYEQTRPWAAAMAEAVQLRKMPPWFADARYGEFSNDRSLTQKDIDTISAWAKGGAPKGDSNNPPPPVEFAAGWAIPNPDVVFEMPLTYQIPATGTIEYQKIIIPTGFTEDKWVQFAEARPDNRAHIHHIIAYVREPGSHWLQGEKPGVFFVAPKPKDENIDTSSLPSDFLVGYAPGQPPEMLAPGQAKLIKAGSDIVFEIHYTTDGTPGTDRSKVGMVFAKQPPKERVLTLSATNGTFRIPPGDPSYEVDSEFVVRTPVKLVSLHPHMHGRGKDFEYRLLYPTGETEKLLLVPKYNWHWQLWYTLAKPVVLPRGTKIQCTAHFDNSPNNPDNADPTKEVRWGDQSWDEMMVGFFNLAFDANMPVNDLLPSPESGKVPHSTN
ncbi:MAG TPA: thiol-disulfide isomerase [Terriglobia bacterium]|nr:thiol-disulfide isomerase [Terriglobia bacterium]